MKCMYTVIAFNPLRSTALLTTFLEYWLINFLNPPLKNYTTILTISLIGLKIDTSFVLTNRPVDLSTQTMF